MINPESSLIDTFEYFLAQPEPYRADSTKKKYRIFFKAFLAEYGHWPIGDIDKGLVHSWFEHLEGLGYSRGYLAFHRNCFHAFFAWCADKERELTADNPAHKLRKYPETAVVLEIASEIDVERCLVACEAMWDTLKNQRDAAIFALGSVGLRRSNVAGVTFSEMKRCLARPQRVGELGEVNMYVLPTTGKRPMEAVFDERRAKIIKRYVHNRPKCNHNWLFVSVLEGHKPLSRQLYYYSRLNVCRVAGVPLITFQQMRRMIGSKVARERGTLIASHVLGHASEEIVKKHYYNPDVERARLAAFESLFIGK